MKKILTILPILLILVQTGCEEKAAATEKTNSAKETKVEYTKGGPAKVTETAPVWNGTPNIKWFNASETEFTIKTAEDFAGLISLANSKNDFFEGKTIKLGKNIMLNDTADWQDWAKKKPKNIWKPIEKFSGVFDGNGCTISGIYINEWQANNQGLFGESFNGGVLKNVSIEASYIRGSSNVGGLVGLNSGSIINSYYAGAVAGSSNVGGLAGKAECPQCGGCGPASCSEISNSYSTGAVTGTRSVGGLVGLSGGGEDGNSGIISNSYSIGKVVGKTNVGGLVGENSESKILNSYYNRETSEQSDKGKGDGKSTAEMQSKEFVDNANTISGLLELNAWIYESGKYPSFSDKTIKSAAGIDNFFAGGNGTRANPYIISTKKQLEDFSMLMNTGVSFLDKYLKLDSDIMLNDTANWKNWASSAPDNAWASIGSITNPFDGTFDGDGHVISGVYINSTDNNEGLFGCLGVIGTIKNLNVAASYIKGGRFVGGLAGVRNSEVYTRFVLGNMVEVKSKGKISNSNYTGEVKGVSNTGKLFGGEKQKSYFEGAG
jgi:hypothetical protein